MVVHSDSEKVAYTGLKGKTNPAPKLLKIQIQTSLKDFDELSLKIL